MMWNRSRTIAVGGVVAGLVLAGGGTAIAASQSGSSSPNPAPVTHAKAHRAPAPWLSIASRTEHGQFVTASKKGPVTHDVINGDVTAVSATAITVKAKDGTTETYAVTPRTKVRIRTAGKGTAGTISEVKTGDHVVVVGTGTSRLTADQVVDIHR